MRTQRFWQFTPAAPSNATRQQPAPSAPAASSNEPRHLAETDGVDIGTDAQALAWAEEHDPETAELLKAGIADDES